MEKGKRPITKEQISARLAEMGVLERMSTEISGCDVVELEMVDYLTDATRGTIKFEALIDYCALTEQQVFTEKDFAGQAPYGIVRLSPEAVQSLEDKIEMKNAQNQEYAKAYTKISDLRERLIEVREFMNEIARQTEGREPHIALGGERYSAFALFTKKRALEMVGRPYPMLDEFLGDLNSIAGLAPKAEKEN